MMILWCMTRSHSAKSGPTTNCCSICQTGLPWFSKRIRFPPFANFGTVNSRIVIYQLFPRLFSNTRETSVFNGSLSENGCGKFNHLDIKVLEAIADLGCTHIWLTGILRHSTKTDYSYAGLENSPPDIVKGTAGSPYAVQDYFDVDPDLAQSVPNRMIEFMDLVDRIHQIGLKVIIDFIPNHVARNYHSLLLPDGCTDLGEKDDKTVWFSAHNNFYYFPGQELTIGAYHEFPARATGNDVFHANPGIHDWYETVKLNYGYDYAERKGSYYPIPATWIQMTRILEYWADKGIDGFRCDMAGMVPVEFWEYSIPEIKKLKPEVKFIAEIYEPARYREFTERGMFDYLYDKCGMYDTLRQVIQGQTGTYGISAAWQSLEGLDDRMLRFLENHDEQRIASPQFAGDAMMGLPGMAVCSMLHRGPIMIYNGQEVGEAAPGVTGFSGDDGRTSIFDYTSMPELLKWFNGGLCDGKRLQEWQIDLRKAYCDLLHLAKLPILAEGGFYDLTWANQDRPESGSVYSFLKHGNDAKGTLIWLVAVTFDQTLKNCRIRIPVHALEYLGLTEVARVTGTSIQPNTGNTSNYLMAQMTNAGIEMDFNRSGYSIVEFMLP